MRVGKSDRFLAQASVLTKGEIVALVQENRV